MKPWIVIAVDGVAASGKGTLSRLLAKEFNLSYLDTGKLYRALTLYLVAKRRKRLFARDVADFMDFIRFRRPPEEELQSEFVSRNTPNVAKQGWARRLLLGIQRDFAYTPVSGFDGSILDGRDIGTVVCPDADVKLYIVADVETRAARRVRQLADNGERVDYQKVLSDLRARDKGDAERAVSPLFPAPDAVVLDTSELDIAQALHTACDIVRESLARQG